MEGGIWFVSWIDSQLASHCRRLVVVDRLYEVRTSINRLLLHAASRVSHIPHPMPYWCKRKSNNENDNDDDDDDDHQDKEQTQKTIDQPASDKVPRQVFYISFTKKDWVLVRPSIYLHLPFTCIEQPIKEHQNFRSCRHPPHQNRRLLHHNRPWWRRCGSAFTTWSIRSNCVFHAHQQTCRSLLQVQHFLQRSVYLFLNRS